MAAIQDRDRFYLGTTKTSENKVRETVLNQCDDVPNRDVQFLMDTGAEYNALLLVVHQNVTIDMDLKKLDKKKTLSAHFSQWI